MSRTVSRVLLGSAVVLLLLLATFAIPIREWRTGRLPAAPLPLASGDSLATVPKRVWIDTDAACGQSDSTDPDDCLAIVLLARDPDLEIVGISTVFGNASLDITDATTRQLVALLPRDNPTRPLPVYRGSASAREKAGSAAPTPAAAALADALRAGPLTLIALGPLTNIAAALDREPALQPNVVRLIAVMGRRPGHLFHPAEGGSRDAMLFGHGPVFRDLNFDKDRAAAARLLDMGLPMTLVPYDAGRSLALNGEDLVRMERRGGAAAWSASRAQGWLRFWKEEVGKEGFHPFDLVAATYAVAPGLLQCARANAWIADDAKLWRWFYAPESLLVGVNSERPANVVAESTVLYCPGADRDVYEWLVARLAGGAR